MQDSDKLQEILITCSLVKTDGEVVSHAGTFLRQKLGSGFVTIRYYDPIENHFFERGGHRIKYQEFFDRYDLIIVNALKGR